MPLYSEKGWATMAFTSTTINSDKAWAPDGYSFAPEDIIPDALVISTSTKSGVIEGDAPVVRVAFVDDAAAGFVAEGQEIPEATPALSEVLISTGKVSQLIRLSREQWTQRNTSEQLAMSIARAVTRRADIAYLQQLAPTPPALGPSTGLLHVAGTVNGGAVAGSLDNLIDLVAILQQNLATPTHILLSPSAWAEFRKLKVGGTSTNQSLIGAGTQDAQALLLSLPVLVNVGVPENVGLVLDSNAVVSAYGSINVAVSDQEYFSSDSIAVRCTFRLGQNVVRPNRIGKFIIGGGS